MHQYMTVFLAHREHVLRELKCSTAERGAERALEGERKAFLEGIASDLSSRLHAIWGSTRIGILRPFRENRPDSDGARGFWR
jgi:hypothetical protein